MRTLGNQKGSTYTELTTVAAKLDHGQWTKAAEEELLRVASR